VPDEPALPTPSKLAVEWLNAGAAYEQNAIVMKFAVRNGTGEVRGAQLIARLTFSAEPPIYSQSQTGDDGTAEMRVSLNEAAIGDATVLVQAQHQGNSVTRKFRLRRSH
jgi:hypothetical protein